MSLLEILTADLGTRDMRSDGQNGHSTSMAIIETVDEVKVTRTAASGAHG
jgi:hypothetical protein